MSRSDGFTLLEVVVAMGLLAGGLLAIAAAQLSALHMSSKSKNLTIAMHLAQETLEQFQAGLVGTTGSESSLDPDPGDTDLTTFDRGWVVTVGSPTPNLVSVTVTVDWIEPKTGVTRTTTLESMRAL